MQHYFQYFRHTIFTHLYILLSVTKSIGAGCPCNSIINLFIYVDEVGFNLTKTRHHESNVIGQRAITNVPGQCGVI